MSPHTRSDTATLRVVVGEARYTDRLSYYDDWMAMFVASSLFDAWPVNLCDAADRRRIPQLLRDADAVVLLHSTNGDTTRYLEPAITAFADRACPLLTFVGNEVNLPGSPISDKRAAFRALAPDFVATQLLAQSGAYLFGDLATRGVVALPHALNPEAFQRTTPQRDRLIDIGVRAVRYLPHLGDDDRNRVHDLFAHHEFDPALRVDISQDRFDRDGWAAFLNSCRGTVSSEAGSWFIERDDATMEAIRAWTVERSGGVIIANDSPLRLLGHKLPWRVRVAIRKLLSRGVIRHEAAVADALLFTEVYDRFFAGRPIPDAHGKCISSRHFDAIGCGTAQILLEGRYNDLLEPDIHYFQLKRDFSNLNDVLDRLKDERARGQVADAALAHVLDHHTYAHRAARIHAVLTGDAPADVPAGGA